MNAATRIMPPSSSLKATIENHPKGDLVTVLVGEAETFFALDRELVYNLSPTWLHMLEPGLQVPKSDRWEKIEHEPDWDLLEDVDEEHAGTLPNVKVDAFKLLVEYMKTGKVAIENGERHVDCCF